MNTYNFQSYSLHQLISNYFLIEKELEIDIINSLESYLSNDLNYEKRGSIFIKKNQVYNLFFSIDTKRKFSISLNKCNSKHRKYFIEDNINSFGKIKTISFEHDLEEEREMKIFISILKKEIKKYYYLLQSTFKDNITSLKLNKLKKLCNLANSSLSAENKEGLINKYKFLVFHKNEGYFIYDEKLLSTIFDSFLEKQLDSISPAQLLIWLIRNPLPFDKSLANEALKANKTLVFSWENAKFLTEANEFWQSAGLLNDFEDTSSYPICSIGNYHLVMATKSKYHSEFRTIYGEIKNELETQFKESIKSFSIYFKSLNRMKEILKEPTIARYIGEVLAPITKSLLKE